MSIYFDSNVFKYNVSQKTITQDISVLVDGTWKTITNSYILIDSSWKNIQQMVVQTDQGSKDILW